MSPINVEHYYQQGIENAKKEDFLLAIKNYNQALELKPDFVDLYKLRGQAYLSLG